MGLDEVKQEILDKAKLEADSIIREAEQEARKIVDDFDKKVSDYRKESEANTKRVIDNLEKREIAQAEFDVKKRLLNKKKEIVDKAVIKAKEETTAYSDSRKQEIINTLFEKAKKEIDVKVVYGNKKDKKFIEILGVDFKERSIEGGIIAETADGKINVDLSFEEIFEDIKDKELERIGSILF